jgi:ATP-dependent protease HslVU (ClpYQ) peptidase subunit
MTCIVGFIDKGKVIIGADSAAVSDFDITIRKDAKVFKNGEFVIGCTSSFRMIQLLRFSFKPPYINEKELYEYMCTAFIDEVRTCFKNGGYLQKYTDGDEKGGTFLVGYKNRLFIIDDDFQVGESTNEFDSVGCGSNYALGALYACSNNDMLATEKVLLALKAASYFSGGVRAPFKIETT